MIKLTLAAALALGVAAPAVAQVIETPTGTTVVVPPGANSRGASRVHLLDAVKASLKRLQLDHIDLY
ncbi:aldo/keto reductase, partial [Methylobacterium sp. WL93]